VTSWETLDVSVAAQRVQRSAAGSAYSRWEGEARAVAVALTGQRGMALACAGGTVNYHQSASAITAATTDALGSNAFVAGAPTTTGWRTASYLVANAYADGVTSVSYAGNTWTAKRGTWRADAAAGNRVTFTTPSAPLNGPNG
jgi:hypothetical protein